MSQAFCSIFALTKGVLSHSYVYTLMGRDGDLVYAKIGYSTNIHGRFHTLIVDCPEPPMMAASIRVWSRKRARQVESALHKALAKWRVNGEWFRFSPADKAEVNRISSEVLESLHQRGGERLRWTRLNIGALIEVAEDRILP